MNGDMTIQDSRQLSSRRKAYVTLVIIEDLNVPPIEEQKAEHAAAPIHELTVDAKYVTGMRGSDIAAPILM